MTKKDAERFNTVMRYKIGNYIFSDIKDIDNYIPKYSEICFLEEWRLILTSSDLQFKGVAHIGHGVHGDHLVRLYKSLKDKKIYIPIYTLTQPAIEISSFLNYSTDFNYLKFSSSIL